MKHMKILIVDDDRELCSMLTEFFRQRGLSVECEKDGIRGLSRATTESFDLLILDVMLPGVDGFTALETLRRKSRPEQDSSQADLRAPALDWKPPC
jgi:DNA-binding response OmpR family regulator